MNCVVENVLFKYTLYIQNKQFTNKKITYFIAPFDLPHIPAVNSDLNLDFCFPALLL